MGEKVNGGLKMIDFDIMEIALKISWIQRIQQKSDAGWKAIPEIVLGDLGGAFPFYLTAVKPWSNGLASRCKLKIWVYLRLCLARPCLHLR